MKVVHKSALWPNAAILNVGGSLGLGSFFPAHIAGAFPSHIEKAGAGRRLGVNSAPVLWDY